MSVAAAFVSGTEYRRKEASSTLIVHTHDIWRIKCEAFICGFIFQSKRTSFTPKQYLVLSKVHSVLFYFYQSHLSMIHACTYVVNRAPLWLGIRSMERTTTSSLANSRGEDNFATRIQVHE